MIIKPIDRKDDFQDLVKVLLYWEYFPVLTGRHTKTLRCSAAPRLAAHITVGSGHSDIYTYLHISTHIYTYLHISTHIYSYLHRSSVALCNLVHHGHLLPPPFQNFDSIPHVAADEVGLVTSASKSSIRRFVITEKAPTRAFLLVESGYYRFHI